ncbi:hypothetical protein MRY82_00345 [bacterium]|nr:hypothetical protein [bacterium]
MNRLNSLKLFLLYKVFLSLAILLYTKANAQNINQHLLGLSVGDSYYFQPKKEAGDFNIGFNHIVQLQKNYQFETHVSYAVEGLNEFWLQPRLNIVSHQFQVKPYFSLGALVQFQPTQNYGASIGFGFIFPVDSLSPFLSLRLSNQAIVMAEKPHELIWEFFQLSALIEF